MPSDCNPIDQRALDSLSVAPPDPDEKHAHDPRQNAGQDKSIAERMARDPANSEARLDAALDESMDASDPPASTQPIHRNDPVPSSGYDEEAEKQRREE